MKTHIAIYIFIAFAISAVFTALELPYLRRLKAGQSIREDGPQAHKSKAGTPTMGGVSIVLSIIVSSFAVYIFNGLELRELVLISAVTLIYGGIGFIDDYIKVIKKRNLGLTAKQKIAAQTAAALLLAVYGFRNHPGFYIPYVNKYFPVENAWFYIPFIVFVVLAMSNAVNLTDGLDGLAASVTAVVALLFSLVSGGPSFIISACICGACLGFLLFNRHPARIFMGDTGSLALGGALAAVAVCEAHTLLLPVAGGVYVLEALSVIIQVAVFKTMHGKRFFRMAPIHHHFELGGWKESKVVIVFVFASIVLCVAAFLAVGPEV